MKPDTTHRLTRRELLLYLAAFVAALLGSYWQPWGFALGV